MKTLVEKRLGPEESMFDVMNEVRDYRSEVYGDADPPTVYHDAVGGLRNRVEVIRQHVDVTKRPGDDAVPPHELRLRRLIRILHELVEEGRVPTSFWAHLRNALKDDAHRETFKE
ncbi:hypothetical protein RI054_09g46900 [Pseudoscourfieldia marina]